MRSLLRKPSHLIIETGFVLIIVGGLISALVRLWKNGFLPGPFFFLPDDTWMDWVNTAEYAHVAGAYDGWGTIYPPLSFAFLKVVTDAQCYKQGLSDARFCDVYGDVMLHLVYVAVVIITAKTFLKVDRKTALHRSVAMSMGMPMLFALDRGNLVLMCYLCLLLGYGPLIQSTRWRWFFAGCVVNFKIYLIGTLFAPLLKSRWRWFEGASLATLFVYFGSLIAVGDGLPGQIYRNILNFSAALSDKVPLDVAYYPLTYGPALALFEGRGYPIADYLGSATVESLTIMIPLLQHTTQGLIVLAALATAYRPGAVSMNRLILLAISMALITSESGYYALIFMMLFIFMEPWRGIGRIYCLTICYILCIPLDITIFATPPVPKFSFLGNRTVLAEYAIGSAPFVRPFLVMTLAAGMALVTIREVWLHCQEEPTGGSGRNGESRVAV